MNEINTSPQPIYLLPPHLFWKMLITLAALTDRVTRIPKVTIALVGDIQVGAVHTDRQVCTPGVEGVLSCQSLDHLAELRTQLTKRPRGAGDHLARMTELMVP